MLLDVSYLVFGIILTIGTFLFVTAEFSFVSLDQASVESRAAAGDKKAAKVLKATRTLSTQLSGAQIGITLTTILVGYTAQNALTQMLSALLDNVGVVRAVSTTVAIIVAAIFINAFSMLFGELIPKNLALAHPFNSASKVVSFQMVFTAICKPLISVLNGISNRFLRRMGIEPQEEISSARSSSELAALVRHSAQEGTLDTTTASLLENTIRIDELSAVDVMTDRGLVHSLPESAMASDVVSLSRDTGHSRFPVVGDSSDEILGLVSLRRAISVPSERRAEVSVLSSSLLAVAPQVPETMGLETLLLQLRDEGLQMAIVVDEYGGVSGIVTLEDVIEEIVGEVSDEHDHRRLGIRAQADGSYIVPGRLRPDELEERTGISVPDEGGYETLAGLMMDRLGRVPSVGDNVDINGVGLSVVAMTGRRVTQIRVTPVPQIIQEQEDPQ